jgi:ribosomal protein S18 acetylase RimI-like enzyme
MYNHIRKFEKCSHSPVWPLIPTAMLELKLLGLNIPPDHPPWWDDPCIAHIEDGKVKGFIVYRYQELESSWFILLAYVDRESRRQSIHSTMFKCLVDMAKENGGILSIRSGTHINNKIAQAAFKKQGRVADTIMFNYSINDWVKGEPVNLPEDK